MTWRWYGKIKKHPIINSLRSKPDYVTRFNHSPPTAPIVLPKHFQTGIKACLKQLSICVIYRLLIRPNRQKHHQSRQRTKRIGQNVFLSIPNIPL